jgi:hypothetical protein
MAIGTAPERSRWEAQKRARAPDRAAISCAAASYAHVPQNAPSLTSPVNLDHPAETFFIVPLEYF